VVQFLSAPWRFGGLAVNCSLRSRGDEHDGATRRFYWPGRHGLSHGGPSCRAGLAVTVFNRTAARAQRWVGEHGGQAAPSPAAAAENADIVLACVGRDSDIDAVARGEKGAFAAMKSGTVFVDHTTASAAIARELAPRHAPAVSVLSMRRCPAESRARRTVSSPSCAAGAKRIRQDRAGDPRLCAA